MAAGVAVTAAGKVARTRRVRIPPHLHLLPALSEGLAAGAVGATGAGALGERRRPVVAGQATLCLTNCFNSPSRELTTEVSRLDVAVWQGFLELRQVCLADLGSMEGQHPKPCHAFENPQSRFAHGRAVERQLFKSWQTFELR